MASVVAAPAKFTVVAIVLNTLAVVAVTATIETAVAFVRVKFELLASPSIVALTVVELFVKKVILPEPPVIHNEFEGELVTPIA
jgi:hypothetical protein